MMRFNDNKFWRPEVRLTIPCGMKKERILFPAVASVFLVLLISCNPAHDVPIFLWHSVGEGSSNDKYDVPADEFERELTAIESFGAKTITLDQLFDARNGKGKLPERAVILTFDESRACQYRVAMPILLKHGMIAETFITAGLIRDNDAIRYIEHDEGGNHPYLIWPEIVEMARSGAFSIQSHSMTHPRISKDLRDRMHSELVESKRLISEKTGALVNFYAYPFGAFDFWYAMEVRKTGYRGALTVPEGIATRYNMFRSSIHRDSEWAVMKTLERFFGKPISTLVP